MPQLDKITFFSQFFWLSFFYLGFYFLIYKYFLPKMSRALKFRKTRIHTSTDGVTNMGEESHKVAHSYQALISTGFTTCKSVLYQNFKGAEDWLNDTVSQANQTRLKNTNTIYISSLGKRSISQRLVISQAFADLSEKSLFALLISTLKSLKKENYSTFTQSHHVNQPLKTHKVEKGVSKSSVVEKQESLNKNKNRQNKEQQQIVGKTSVSKDKNSKTVLPKSSTTKNSKNKGTKKK